MAEPIFNLSDFKSDGKFNHVKMDIDDLAPFPLFFYVNNTLGLTMCQRDVKIELLKLFSIDAKYHDKLRLLELKLPKTFTDEQKEVIGIFFNDNVLQIAYDAPLEYTHILFMKSGCEDTCTCTASIGLVKSIKM